MDSAMEKHEAIDLRNIGRRIRSIRQGEGLTHLEFARKLKVSAVVTEIAENGIRGQEGEEETAITEKCLREVAERIVKAYPVTMEWLLYGADKESDRGETENEEVTVYFPVTLSSDILKEAMYRTVIPMEHMTRPMGDEVAMRIQRLLALSDLYKIYGLYENRVGRYSCVQKAGRQMGESIARFLEKCKMKEYILF